MEGGAYVPVHGRGGRGETAGEREEKVSLGLADPSFAKKTYTIQPLSSPGIANLHLRPTAISDPGSGGARDKRERKSFASAAPATHGSTGYWWKVGTFSGARGKRALKLK